MSDRIEKSIELAAPVGRVWLAVTDSRQFGDWFRAEISGPFVPGQSVRARSTYPGYENVTFDFRVREMQQERLFTFDWPPYEGADAGGYTHVEFTFEATARGTLLRVVESGFDKLPAGRRAKAFSENEGGWTLQMENVAKYIADAA